MNDLASAVERTDTAGRIENSSMLNVFTGVRLKDDHSFLLEFDTKLILHDAQGELDAERSLSGTASAPHRNH